MSQSTIHCRRVVLTSPIAQSTASEAAAAGIPDRELAAVTQALAVKFPETSRDDIREIVDSTYRKLARAARVHAHLIPLTLNLSRSRLAKDTSRESRTDT
ncbi:three-helix bundle dimerization domain-containing protein [Nocardia asteroides]|uniref:Protein-tyrosine-phosphatase-like N-terminal domain-containing protein n=2 Tax=Nocardia asteroides TaxID=1824 RepID=U5EJB0_NOCAS|nr:hypothetical protein NCAST_32_09140 [Nocardia asteroides NBRC 15531]